MVERDPARRPSAKEIVENPIFDEIQRKMSSSRPDSQGKQGCW
ncbi:hypothetical protein SLEP1_g1289 [Rubroshorea leprosula]|uniref:Uncharacterized protein n=1 Tax=Rubroshorea leprosula TaxID=152421 RepID=A0AAV5HNT7_9ROSI|nr:hypothetical protein SLEP1_g1289 [Rubroshorea leprosula]